MRAKALIAPHRLLPRSWSSQEGLVEDPQFEGPANLHRDAPAAGLLPTGTGKTWVACALGIITK
jgi:hypothetical protein